MNKKYLCIIIFIYFHNFFIFSKDIKSSIPPEVWFEKHLQTNDINEKITYLSRSIDQKDSKKWNRYPLSVYLRGCYYKINKQNSKAIKDFIYLTKKYNSYFEPWLEILFIHFHQMQYKKCYYLLKKALKKGKQSIYTLLPFIDIKSFKTLKKPYRLLIFQIKILIETISKKNKSLKKTLYIFDKELKDNSLKNILKNFSTYNSLINTKFVKSFYHFNIGDIVNTRSLIKESLHVNWECEINPFFVVILHRYKNFRNYFIELKEEFYNEKYKQPWQKNRKDWLIKKWENLYTKYKNYPIILNIELINSFHKLNIDK